MKEFVEVQKGAAKREAAMAHRVNQLAATGATGGDEEYSFLQVDPPYHIDFDGKPGAETGAETGAEVGVAMTGSEEATSPALKWKEQELRALELAHKTEMNRDMDVIEHGTLLSVRKECKHSWCPLRMTRPKMSSTTWSKG